MASSATVAESRMLMTGEVINSSAVVATTRRSSSSKGVPASATMTASRNVTIDGMSTLASRWIRSASVTIPMSSPCPMTGSPGTRCSTISRANSAIGVVGRGDGNLMPHDISDGRFRSRHAMLGSQLLERTKLCRDCVEADHPQRCPTYRTALILVPPPGNRRNTARAAASGPLSPCASNPPIDPLRTSPLPAVASDGGASAATMAPSALATTVRPPLSDDGLTPACSCLARGPIGTRPQSHRHRLDKTSHLSRMRCEDQEFELEPVPTSFLARASQLSASASTTTGLPAAAIVPSRPTALRSWCGRPKADAVPNPDETKECPEQRRGRRIIAKSRPDDHRCRPF